jgi:hypothetical protein
MSRLIVQVQVFKDGELFLSRDVLTPRSVTVGPNAVDTIPTVALERSIAVLRHQPGGFGVRLCSPMSGQLHVGDRLLRVEDGLLLDPRPEPLTLGHGDRGTLWLDQAIELRFTIHRRQVSRGRFTRPDVGLIASLAGTAAAVLVLLCVMSPWSWSPRMDPAKVVERRLTQRPAALDLTRLRPARVKPSTGKRPRERVARSTKAAPQRRTSPTKKAGRPSVRRRGLLGALRRSSKLAGLVKPGLSRSMQQALQGLDRVRTLTSTRGLLGRSDPGGGSRSGDPIMGLISGVQSRLATASSAGPAKPSLRRLVEPVTRVKAKLQQPQTGQISREAIRKVVMKGSRGVRLCYERELISSTRPLEGRLLLRWRIDPTGRAREITVVKDAPGSPTLNRCILDRIRSWRFRPCSGTCTVVYPFDFFPKMS